MSSGEETRKIQFTGKSTYIISLPKQWITDLGLKQGDQVSVGRKEFPAYKLRHTILEKKTKLKQPQLKLNQRKKHQL